MRSAAKYFGLDSRFEIVGVAHDGVEALALIEKLKPDVVTLDIQMPRMDGLTALKHIMIRDPRPVVVLSAFTKQTSRLTYESFKYGAVDVCTKPSKGDLSDGKGGGEQIARRRGASLPVSAWKLPSISASNNGNRTTRQNRSHARPE